MNNKIEPFYNKTPKEGKIINEVQKTKNEETPVAHHPHPFTPDPRAECTHCFKIL